MLTIRVPESLILAIDRIHDRWFDVDSIKYDSSTRTVSIPFWSEPTSRPPLDASGQPPRFDDLLVVHDADEPRIEDREQIGIYGFNDIKLRGRQMLIRAEPNLRISISIGSLHITVGIDTTQ